MYVWHRILLVAILPHLFLIPSSIFYYPYFYRSKQSHFNKRYKLKRWMHTYYHKHKSCLSIKTELIIIFFFFNLYETSRKNVNSYFKDLTLRSVIFFISFYGMLVWIYWEDGKKKKINIFYGIIVESREKFRISWSRNEHVSENLSPNWSSGS